MTGLEKIKDQILAEARQTAEKKKAAAQNQADKILRAAKETAEQTTEKMEAKSKADEKSYQEQIQSACDLKRRKMLLEAKQKIIAETLEQAYQTAKQTDTAAYFSMMEKLLAQSVQPAEGRLYFSKEDLERMPEDFPAKAEALAREKGGSLTLEKEAKELDGGFLLVYGGIEENCTLRALFHSNRERLQDLVNEYLWRNENG